MGTRCCRGMLLGRSSKSDSHIVGTPTNIQLARTVKPIPNGFYGNPWGEHPEAERCVRQRCLVNSGPPTTECPACEYAQQPPPFRTRGRSPHHNTVYWTSRAEFERAFELKVADEQCRARPVLHPTTMLHEQPEPAKTPSCRQRFVHLARQQRRMLLRAIFCK